MADEIKRPLKVFLCHASGDKPAVRDLYKRLVLEGVDAWLDQEKLLPGQNWRLEIPNAVREADVVVICLSAKSITKEGYVQKEIKFALDFAEEKPDGTIFLIPARLEDCNVPDLLSRWQWVNLYEENGFSRLLRSLKLRADKINATIGPIYYKDTERELEQKLNQLYMEGLAAFYTEDWDKACHRFQSILSERPNHKNATEKLAEAEHQRKLEKLYSQATDFLRCEDWSGAVRSLEELSLNEKEYKDVTQLLKNARQLRQLEDLYSEAKALHFARQWTAVVKVFEQIALIDPNYSDQDALLTSAQKEVTEIKRIEQLNNLYSHALHEIDAGKWVEARGLLQQVIMVQPEFLETQRLLKKVEKEIAKTEEQIKRNNDIRTLYEQAHGLIRAKSWRNALDKIEQIQKLDDTFVDKDEIAKKAQDELDREERDAQLQNQLAAMYAESVRLLKDGRYKESLDKWQEVKEIDPKYPDRQKVEGLSRKKLSELTKSLQNKSRILNPRQIGIVSFLVFVMAIVTWGYYEFLYIPPGSTDDLPTPNHLPPTNIQTSTPQSIATIVPYGHLIYSENFDMPNLWWKLGNSRADNGNLLLSPDVDAYPFTASGNRAEYANFILDSRFLNPLGSGSLLFYLRYQYGDASCSNCSIQVGLDFSDKTIVGRRIRGDKPSQDIASESILINPTQWNKITVVVNGNNYEVYLNDSFIMNFTDDTYESGSFVLHNDGPNEIKIDYVYIYDLP